MTNKELFYFMGKCLTLGDNKEHVQAVIQTIQQKKVDWSRFVSMGSNHLILPSLYLRFKAHGILSFLPVELSEHLKMVYELNYQRNITILEQIDRINSLLVPVKIIPVYLKGAGNLLDHLYEDVGERMLGDIDFLVSEEEFIKVANLLKGEGYEQSVPFNEENLSITKHFPRLIHPKAIAGVEVHRCPVEVSLSSHFNYAVIRPKAKLIETEPPCYVLSDKHKVILNFMHGFMANDVKLMHVVSFRNMVDLYNLSQRVNVFEALAQQPHYASKALIYADFVHHTMGMAIPHKPSLRSQFFLWKYDLLLTSRFLYNSVWITRYVFNQLSSFYLPNIVGMFVHKQIRKTVFQKLSNPTWCRNHIKAQATIFKQNLGK